MSVESASVTRRRAVEAGGDAGAVWGPLRGYHHETYVFPLAEREEQGPPAQWKCREPRPGLLWFDRRCFASEEELLTALSGRITGIPDVREFGGLRLQRFIEGETLGLYWKPGQRLPGHQTRQILELFRQTVAVTPETLLIKRRCKSDDRPENRDTDGFLERLVSFAEESVYRKNAREFEELFGELGIDGDAFKKLRKHVSGLRERPFCLLHADLHRENFIVDGEGALWAIDWELAMFGDPLYDLATHLYLMRYPEGQAHEVAEEWATTVEAVREGSSNGWRHDLKLLLDYKRAQSVFTDVIREALSLPAAPVAGRWRLDAAGRRLNGVLAEAAVSLGLDSVPEPGRIGKALERWCLTHGPGSGGGLSG
ncbi:aminoglycoside phosphotransferase family protein [Streptomyces cadmiisoli]|uniref:Aminoglycoside phosphotransferase family protein n=1 Tax=Streptomyces cadmiisoli TaxID=2184053 RepID=A0A2Z4J2E8_9ACTN|nr:aminoglycoside phosphotransferase family protein [Streptomyces cadmiisoli]AWW38878.1 aminoglycoside phosphotransferase family protein [Streptomyces cadmiisoli]